LAASCSGCGEGGTSGASEPKVPDRAPTCGDPLFGSIPAGAEILLEVDLARLRGNSAVGALVQRLDREHLRNPAAPGLSFAPFALMGLSPDIVARADVLVMASYGVGTDEAASLVLARGDDLRGVEAPGAARLDERTVAVGARSLVDRVGAVARGESPAVTGDRRLLALRAAAMPEKATGAAVRIAALLGFDARVELAARLDLDEVPAALSAWGDVADDLAVVAILGGDDRREAARLARAAERWRGKMARRSTVRRLLPGGLGDLVKVHQVDAEVRVLFIVGPHRLARLVRRIEAGLGAELPSTQ